MATIRSYTTIEQSKVLAEILPPESADMCYTLLYTDASLTGQSKYNDFPCVLPSFAHGSSAIPCWSLATLLGVLPKYELYNFGDTIQLDVNREALATEGDETLLDLVVNMIIHLYKIKML